MQLLGGGTSPTTTSAGVEQRNYPRSCISSPFALIDEEARRRNSSSSDVSSRRPRHRPHRGAAGRKTIRRFTRPPFISDPHFVPNYYQIDRLAPKRRVTGGRGPIAALSPFFVDGNANSATFIHYRGVVFRLRTLLFVRPRRLATSTAISARRYVFASL